MTDPIRQRALVLHPSVKKGAGVQVGNGRQPSDSLEEAVGLAMAIQLDIVEKRVVMLSALRPSTLFGKGKVEEIKDFVHMHEIQLVIIDHVLSPGQQRNLERAWNCKVIDRTALILEIFADRARTKEGKLQVELAQLTYQKSRLVRSWTHLERQRGGFGFMGGPGETQIEADRRMIDERITKIRRQLETVVRTRELHRKTRKDVPYPQVALVGYTNAGKSTLFNYLTGAEVLAEDKLFATLDPTLRAVRLPSGIVTILSDTVGFVSDLPTELVAAFRATLEEVVEADVLLHVRDISHPDTAAQKADVLRVLRGLRGESSEENMIEVWNKVDLLDADAMHQLQERGDADMPVHATISAQHGTGVDALITLLDKRLYERLYQFETVRIAASEGRAISWLYSHGHVLNTVQDVTGEHLTLEVRMAGKDFSRFRKLFPNAA